MESTIQLFSIMIKSDYYADGISQDFSIEPDNNSEQIFKRYNLQWLHTNGEYKLMWLTKNIKNIPQCRKTIFQDIHFFFNIKTQNINVYNFSQIDTNKIYSFANKYTGFFLHKKSEVSEEDLSKRTDYADKLFGFIKIDMNNITNIPASYIIKIPTIKSFWQINFSGNEKKIKNIKKFFLDGEKYNFTNMNGSNNNVFISSNSIPLKSVGLHNLSVYVEDETILLSSPIYYDRITHDGQYISEINCCL